MSRTLAVNDMEVQSFDMLFCIWQATESCNQWMTSRDRILDLDVLLGKLSMKYDDAMGSH